MAGNPAAVQGGVGADQFLEPRAGATETRVLVSRDSGSGGGKARSIASSDNNTATVPQRSQGRHRIQRPFTLPADPGTGRSTGAVEFSGIGNAGRAPSAPSPVLPALSRECGKKVLRQPRHRPPHGCTTVILSGTDLPTPRSSGRYMSSTSGGGAVYEPGVTARTR